MTIIEPQYEQDFFDVIQGLQEDIVAHQDRIYRQIEANVISVYKEIQRIQGNIVAQIAQELPGRLSEITTSLQRST